MHDQLCVGFSRIGAGLRVLTSQSRSAAMNPYGANPPLTWHISTDVCLLADMGGMRPGRALTRWSPDVALALGPRQSVRLTESISALSFGPNLAILAGSRDVSKSSEMCRKVGNRDIDFMGWRGSCEAVCVSGVSHGFETWLGYPRLQAREGCSGDFLEASWCAGLSISEGPTISRCSWRVEIKFAGRRAWRGPGRGGCKID